MISSATPPEKIIVKICGITRLEDGLCALEAGADWLGFIRWPKSPRWQPLNETAKLIKELRMRAAQPFQATGVFVDASPDEIEKEIQAAAFDRIQLHGNESPETISAIKTRVALPLIKAIH